MSLRDNSGAINDYSKAIEITPNFTIAYISRGKAKENFGKHIEAILDYEKAIRLDPDNTFAKNRLVELKK